MWASVAAAAAYQAFGAQERVMLEFIQQNTRPHAYLAHTMSARVIPTPCPYCHRTSQTHGHKSCDGCGAPR